MTGPDTGWLSKLGQIPDPDAPAGQLAHTLRELAGTANATSLRRFPDLLNYAPTTISDALSGKPRLVPTLEVIKAIGKACNADEPTQARLRDLRAEAIKSKPLSTGPGEQATPELATHDLPKPDPVYRRWECKPLQDSS